MPTIFMTSAERLAISLLEVTPCARIASLNWEPIDFVGLSAFIALCITTDRSCQRIAVSEDSVRPTRFLPLNITVPPVISAGERQQLRDREQHRRLAAAGLADDADELAGREREAHVVDGEHAAAVHQVLDRQIANVENRAAGLRFAGAVQLCLARRLLIGRRAGLPISSNA